MLKFNPFTEKFDITDPVDTSAFNEDNILMYKNSKIAQAAVGKLLWDSVYSKFNAFNVDVGINTSTVNIYVSTTGNDGFNTGLTSLSPFLTIEKAISVIPLFTSGVYQINLANGTYTLSPFTNSIEFQHIISKSGTSDYKSVIKIVGNTTTPNSVQIRAYSQTANIFTATSPHTLIDIDGVDLRDCASAITANGGFVILRGVNITNFMGNSPAISVINGGFVQWQTGTTGRVLTALSTGSPTGGIFVQRYGIFERYCNLTFNGIHQNTAISVGNYGRWIDQSVGGLTMTITGHTTLVMTTAVTVSTNAVATLRGTLNISYATTGFDMGAFGSSLIVAGSIFAISNCTTGVLIEGLGAWNETGACNFTFTTVVTPVNIQHGGMAKSPNNFGGNPILYNASNYNLHGYDDRYVKRRSTVVSTNTDYTFVIPEDVDALEVDASGGNRIVNLPDVSLNSAKGTVYTITKVDSSANTVTILPIAPGQPISGSTSKVITLQWGTFTVRSNGLKWTVN